MRDGLDIEELTDFADGLIKASKEAAKTKRKFLQKQGTKLKRRTKASMRAQGVKTHTGNYAKGIKKGKVWTDKMTGSMSVRVYSAAPHAHLIEDGHRQVVNPGKGPGGGRGVKPGRGVGRQVGKVSGREVFAKAQKDFEPQFTSACEDMLDELVSKI